MRKEPTNISIEKTTITYNGKDYNITQFAAHINISVRAVYRRMEKYKSRLDGLKELVFLVEHGYPNRSTVFKRDGMWTCSHDIKKMSGCPLSSCYKRGERWAKGEWSDEDLARPTLYGGNTGKTKRHTNANGQRKWKLDVGPRKDIDSIPGAGSWEQKHIKDRGEDYVVGVEVGNTGKSSSGGFITR